MENWSDQGIVLRARAHGESGAVVTILSKHHGRFSGYLRGGQSSRFRSIIEIGNLVSAHWSSRIEDQLGFFTIEPDRHLSSGLMGEPLKLGALLSACALCEAALPEREGHAGLFHGLLALLDAMDGDFWGPAYVMWEISLLRELGFSLDLNRCVAGGNAADLAWVSPKSGGAVSAQQGAPYKEKLLTLPCFLRPIRSGGDAADVADGLKMTGHFLEHWVFAQHSKGIPEERRHFVERYIRFSSQAVA